MKFILNCTLAQGVEERRLAFRLRHLTYISDHRSMILFGGPALGASGTPEEMVLVIDAADEAAAARFSHDEPYTANGVFSDVRIRRWAEVLPELVPGSLDAEIEKEKRRMNANKSYVLVHGAWMGAWAWDRVAAGLRANGSDVVAVELPGHGADETPLAGATLEAYVAKVEAAVRAAGRPVVLVGHSMAGMVVTQVAENQPDAIERLVYLAAYLPKDGQKLLDLALTDADSLSGRNAKIDEKNGIAEIPPDCLAADFLADGSTEAIATLLARYRAEPLAGFVAPVKTTAARWGRVPKVYIHTKQDKAVSFALQQRMTADVTFVSTVTLDTSHAPFLSQPALVVETLRAV